MEAISPSPMLPFTVFFSNESIPTCCCYCDLCAKILSYLKRKLKVKNCCHMLPLYEGLMQSKFSSVCSCGTNSHIIWRPFTIKSLQSNHTDISNNALCALYHLKSPSGLNRVIDVQHSLLLNESGTVVGDLHCDFDFTAIPYDEQACSNGGEENLQENQFLAQNDRPALL